MLRAFPSQGLPRLSRLGRPANAANGRLPPGRREPGAGPSELRFSPPASEADRKPSGRRAGSRPSALAGRTSPSARPRTARPVAGSSLWPTCRSAAGRRVRLVSLAAVIQAGFRAHAPRQPKARRRGVRQDGLPVPVSPAQRAATRTAAATPGFAAAFPTASGPGEQSGLDGEETDQKGFPSPGTRPGGKSATRFSLLSGQHYRK